MSCSVSFALTQAQTPPDDFDSLSAEESDADFAEDFDDGDEAAWVPGRKPLTKKEKLELKKKRATKRRKIQNVPLTPLLAM